MSRHILISGFFFVYLMLVWPSSAYCTHEGGSPHATTDTTTTSDQLPTNATTPNTQSTANMDSANMMRTADDFIYQSGDFVGDKLTDKAQARLYEWAREKMAAEERLKKEKTAEEKLQKWLSEPSSSEYEAERKEGAKQFREEEKRRKEEWEEFNRKMSEELGSVWDPVAGKVRPSPFPKAQPPELPKPRYPTTPPPSPKDDWDFLPDFIPGVSVYENMPEMPVAPEAVTSPQKGQAPADGKSGGSSSSQDRGSELDLIVQ